MAEQIYKVRDPQGNIREIRGPANASDDEVIAQAKKLFGAETAPPTLPALQPSRQATPDGLPGARRELTTGQRVYQAVRPFVEPLVTGGAAIGGGVLGGTAGTFGGGPVGTATGGVVGAGLGYGIGKEAMELADVAMGMKQPRTGAETVVEPLRNVVEGGLYETAGRLAAPALNRLIAAGAQGLGKVMDINQLPRVLAGKTARESLGGAPQVAAARQALATAEAEGLDLTAQQALARAGTTTPTTQAVLEKAIKRTPTVDVRATKEAAQEAARKAALKDITPDLDAAIKARASAAKPFYEAADKAVVAIDQDLADVITRMPEGTLAQAANIAKMEGRPFIMGKTAPAQMVETGVLDAAGRPVMREVPGEAAQITGESLHYIKRALGDVAYGVPTTQAGRDAQLAARKLLSDFTTVFETKVPDYAAARRVFSEKSAPVNQAQVLREMLSVLEKPGGGERIGPFLNVLGRGEEAMLKRAGGRGGPRFEALSEVLTPDQLAKVKDIAKQLETETAIGKQVTEGQQRATQLIKDELPNLRVPNVFSWMITTTNRVLDALGARVGKRTMETLAEASMSAKSFDELLGTLPATERSKVLKAISDPNTWRTIKPAVSKAVTGAAAATNALAPERTNTNALATQPVRILDTVE